MIWIAYAVRALVVALAAIWGAILLFELVKTF